MPVKHYCAHHGKNATHDTDECRTLETLARMNSISNMCALTKTSKKRTHSPAAPKHDGKKQKLQQAKKAKDIKPEVKDDTLPKEKTAEEQARLDKKAAKNKEKKRKWHERWLKKQEEQNQQAQAQTQTQTPAPPSTSTQTTAPAPVPPLPPTQTPTVKFQVNLSTVPPLPDSSDEDLVMST